MYVYVSVRGRRYFPFAHEVWSVTDDQLVPLMSGSTLRGLTGLGGPLAIASGWPGSVYL